MVSRRKWHLYSRDKPSSPADECYQGAHYNHHSSHDWFKYSDLVTVAVDVPGTSDVTSNDAGKNLNHPKVYVGFFSHSAYDRPDTSIVVNAGMLRNSESMDDFAVSILTKCE